METLFWLSVALVLYVYAGYPLLLGIWAAIVRQRARRTGGGAARPGDVEPLPGVSVVLAARNEAARLPARLDNLLACSYPADRLQIVVASDGSTDGIEQALDAYAERVELLLLPACGKAHALNAAVARARHPVLVFADARQQFAPDAILHLARRMQQPGVGAVSGELMLDTGGSTIGEGLGVYWSYEKWIRRQEAVVGSTLGVTGAIYAMRRSLWQPLPPDTLLDDVLGPMRMVLEGYRVTFDGNARAFDAAPRDASEELRRKMRTLTGNFQLLSREPRLLLPGLNPVWLQFVSHKVGRLFVPYALLAILVTSAVLAPSSWFYAAVFGGQALFYGLAAYGAALDRRGRASAMTPEVKREAA